MKKILFGLSIVLILCLCSCSNKNSNEEETSKQIIGGVYDTYQYFVGNIVKFGDENTILVSVDRPASSGFEVNEEVYVSFEEVIIMYDVTDEKDMYALEDSFIENDIIDEYYSELAIGDIVLVQFKKGKIDEKDDKKFVSYYNITKYVYDPHLDKEYESYYNNCIQQRESNED